MKTLTEFPALFLKNAQKTQQELTAAGKTPEELPAALGESLKVEGDRLNFLNAAIEVLGTKLEDLKRVVVFSLNEGEKAPSGYIQKGEHYFLVEYYPSLNKKQPDKSFDDRKQGRGKKRGGKGGRGGDRDRNRGPRRNEAGEGQAAAAGPSEGGSDSDRPRPPRNRRPRRPHAPAQVQDPNAPRRPPLKPVTPIQAKPAESEAKTEEPKSNPTG